MKSRSGLKEINTQQKMKSFPKYTIKPLLLFCLGLPVCLPSIVIAETSGDKNPGSYRWELQVGVGIRQSFGLRLDSQSRNLTGGGYDSAEALQSILNAVGPVGSSANRVYDDGFLNVSSAYNMSTHWGFTDASQIQESSMNWDQSQPWDRSGHESLYLSQTGELGISSYQRSANTGKPIFPYVELRRLWKGEEDRFWWERGLVFSWSWMRANARTAEPLGFTRTTVTDEYYLYGITLPPAPYGGPETPPGPLLDDIPHARVIRDTSESFSGLSSTRFGLDLHTLSFGYIWRHLSDSQRSDPESKLRAMDFQAGLSLNYVRLKMNSETVVLEDGQQLADFREQARRVRYPVGFYASIGTITDIGEPDEWFFFSQIRYDYLGKIRVASDHFKLSANLSGFSLRLGIGRYW